MRSAELIANFRRAVESGDVAEVVALIEPHWVYLLRYDSSLLRRGLAGLPGGTSMQHPGLILLIEIFETVTPGLRAAGDASIARLTKELDDPSPALDDQRRASLGLLALVALRRRGQLASALDLGSRLVELAGRGREAQDEDSPLPAGIFLQVGIAQLLAGELEAATRFLTLAFRKISPFPNHAVDAAGKLALIHALKGEGPLVGIWVRRAHELEPASSDWLLRSLERTALATAQAIQALDRLDWVRFQQHSQSAQAVSPPEDWGLMLHARARASLLLGTQRSTLRQIRDYREQYPHLVPSRGMLGIVLGAAEADLRLSLGQLDEAATLIDDFGDHPIEVIISARHKLLNRQSAAARTMIMKSDWPDTATRRERVELLLLAFTCELRLRHDQDERTRLARGLATEIADDSSAWLFTFALVDRDVTDALPTYAPELADLTVRLHEVNPVRPFLRGPISLTPRERTVLEHFAEHSNVNEIANRLHVSPATIKNQRKSLYRKLGATSRTQALEIAARAGLLENVSADEGE